MKINFTKATAAGNDFVMIDYRNISFEFSICDFVKAACDRKFGIGADGVIFIENDKDAEFLMRYFNADGSEGSLCGNGARSAAKYMSGLMNKNHLCFKAVGKIYEADIKGKEVKLFLPDLNEDIKEYDFNIDEINIHSYFIDTGSPHVVIFEELFPDKVGLEQLDVFNLGRKIRYHDLIAPGGANINFVKVLNEESIKIRTYERGVEDETLACGTGSIASAIISRFLNKTKTPVSVFTQGGDRFEVNFNIQQEKYSALSLEGPAIMVFDGLCFYDESLNILSQNNS